MPPKPAKERRFVPKELSWLAFNRRVLQEARDPDVPLLDRLRFLGIYSSNLDEFYRVRVATLRRLALLGSRTLGLIGYDAGDVLEKVRRTVLELSAEYETAYEEIVEGLAAAGVCLRTPDQLDEGQRGWMRRRFRERIRAEIAPLLLMHRDHVPDLRSGSLQLVVRLSDSKDRHKTRHALIELPPHLPRFHVLPGRGAHREVLILDDIVRDRLPAIFALFPHDKREAWAMRLSRDAELDMDDDIRLGWSAKMAASLKKRERGAPVRLVYDSAMPKETLALVTGKLGVSKHDTLVPGGRHLRRSDFIQFPEIGRRKLRYPAPLVAPHCDLPEDGSLLASIRRRDVLLHVPYNPFDQFVELLREAALDPKVTAIRMTLYRLARHSDVIRSLIAARRCGKEVTAVVELQARFDEQANIDWAERLKEAGVEVIFGIPGLKVHAKLLMIERRGDHGSEFVAGVGTGNFNEDSAAVFEDMLLLTADRRITKEVAQLFTYFRRSYLHIRFQHLLVSPWITRERVDGLIAAEVARAKKGHRALVDLKLNHLADPAMVETLHQAAEAGVEVRLNVRGMFSMQPGQSRGGTPIQAMAVIDRYLEHSRLLRFHQGGKPLLYLGSGDLMPRNLDHRIEVYAPVLSPRIRAYVERVMDLHWEDRASARVLDDKQSNQRRAGHGRKRPRVQQEIARLNQELHRCPEQGD